jgi:hypothetical protein
MPVLTSLYELVPEPEVPLVRQKAAKTNRSDVELWRDVGYGMSSLIELLYMGSMCVVLEVLGVDEAGW